MANNNVEFEIQDCKLLSAIFDINKIFPPDTQINIAINLVMDHTYNDAESTLNLIMSLNVTGEEVGMNISIKYGGVFKFKKKPEPEEHLSKTAEITCASILFPFLRETVADLTRRAGLTPLLLKPVNFISFYENGHPPKKQPQKTK